MVLQAAYLNNLCQIDLYHSQTLACCLSDSHEWEHIAVPKGAFDDPVRRRLTDEVKGPGWRTSWLSC